MASFGRPRRHRIDLGLALLSVVRQPGVELTQADIAAWCDCSAQTILNIKRSALAKMRAKLTEIDALAEVENAAMEFGGTIRSVPASF